MLVSFRGKWPEIHETAFIAPTADIIGDVRIGSQSSVWFQVVIRGDVHSIRIGSRTNIQDHSMLHVTRKSAPLEVGDDVTIGHRVTLHGARLGNRILVGMGAIVLDHAQIGDDCLIGAGALILQRSVIPPKSLVYGSPAKVVRSLLPQELASLRQSALHYTEDAKEYHGLIPGPKRAGSHDEDLDYYPLTAVKDGFEED
jgi:gamma-carbonic anhydrase